MDFATVVGIIAGFALVVLSLGGGGEGDKAVSWVHIPSLMVVVGGMSAATLIHFSMGQVLRITSVVKKTLFCKLLGEHDLIQKMVNYSAINRRDGALALEQQFPTAGDDFLVRGLQMVIDGQKEEEISEQLSMEIEYLQERHSTGKKILEFMGSAAPAFGMIGTLIGLVEMLGNLKNPSMIGEGMAKALLTTFYGALLANLILLPLAGKLGIRSKRETLVKNMILEGLLGIARGESPTAVRERMQTFVSAKSREDLKPSI